MILHSSGHSILSKFRIYSLLLNLSGVEVLTTVIITLYKQTGNITVKSVCQEYYICFLSLYSSDWKSAKIQGKTFNDVLEIVGQHSLGPNIRSFKITGKRSLEVNRDQLELSF